MNLATKRLNANIQKQEKCGNCNGYGFGMKENDRGVYVHAKCKICNGTGKTSESEQNKIKEALELGNKKARLKARLQRGDLRGITVTDLKVLDPETQAKVLNGAYRQILSNTGVDYLG
ncbi:MAG TPA: hypothetical protein ENI23_07255 [bacterium]|nr:hypothetical protein [bacterium]